MIGTVADLAQRIERPGKAGALAVEPVDHDQPRETELVARRPDLFGLDHRAGDAVDHHRDGIGHVQRGEGVGEEIAHARRVDQVDLVLVPFGIGEAGRQRMLPRDFLFVVIGDGGAVIHLPEAVDHAGVVESGGDELRFS